MESPMVAQIMEEMPIETLKEEMVTMIQEESKTFMEAIEEAPKGNERKNCKRKTRKNDNG